MLQNNAAHATNHPPMSRSFLFALFCLSIFIGYLLNFTLWHWPAALLFFCTQTLIVGFALILLMTQHEKHIWWLIIPFMASPLFALGSALRASPWLTAFNILACVVTVGIFFLNLGKQKISETNLSLWLPIEIFLLIFSSVSEPLNALAENIGRKKNISPKIIKNILIAAIFGFPLVMIVTILLISSDPIFEKYINDILQNISSWLNIENVPKTVKDIFFTGLFSFGFLGIFYSTTKKGKAPLYQGVSRETRDQSFSYIAIIIGGILLCFLIIQVRYLFLGSAAIASFGYTYAAYARRGFYQLLCVAAITFFLSLLITKKNNSLPVPTRSKIIAALLTTETFVLLISAIKRILLYIQAYNWTEKRFFGLVGMIILFVMLIVFLLQIFSEKFSRNEYTFAVFSALLIITLGLNIVNPDAIIARKNIAAYKNGAQEYEFDFDYTSYISSDAAFAGFELFDAARTEREKIRAAEALNKAFYNLDQYENFTKHHWYSFHFSEEKANKLLMTRRPEIEKYLQENQKKPNTDPILYETQIKME